MYTAFYGLREKPFALAPDPRFLFLASSHREALAHVLYGIEQGEGFIAVTGEVGTGKTTLCRTLLERLGRDTEVAFVFNPMLSGEDLLRAVSTEFGLLTEGFSRAQLLDQLNQFLLEQKRARRRVLLIVDEAQNLAADTLEEIRLLSNLETSTSKLIQILLFGQPELDDKLDSRELRQLRQRISVRWSLGSLSAAETREYVRHRLRIAAEFDPDIFSSRALAEIHRRARGIPRLVNLLSDRALLAGYAAQQRRIGPDLVGLAAREILGARRRLVRRRTWIRRSYVAGAALLLLGSGVLAWQQWTRVGQRAPVASTAPPPVMPPVGAAAPRTPQPERVGETFAPAAQPVSKDAG
jgi:general secretion pathway protein A